MSDEQAMKTLNQKIEEIGTARRERVEARAAALIAEEMTSGGTSPGDE
jgi:hypothetical protein